MTTYGITDEGFVIKPLETIKEEVEDLEKAAWGDAIDVTATSILGQINGIISGKLSELWELAQAIFSSSDPDAANTTSLENVAALCPGITRSPATYSTVTATCNLDNGTYPAGSLIAHVDGDPTARFVNTAEVVRTGGTGNESVTMQAETAGAVVALSGTLTEIAEPVSGWNSVTNSTDASVGNEVETDTELRLRRESVIALSGGSSVAGIRADVLAVDGIDICNVRENDTDVYVDDLPPHSFHVVCHTDQDTFPEDDVVQAIFDSKPAGIRSYGSEYVKMYDAGYPIYIYYDEMTEVDIYFEVIIPNFSTEGSAAANIVKAALIAAIAEYTIYGGFGSGFLSVYDMISVVIEVIKTYGDYYVNEFNMDTHASPDYNAYLVTAYNETFVTESAYITISDS